MLIVASNMHIVTSNMRNMQEQLRDPHNLDFRPRPGSVWDVKRIGAYEAVPAGGHYWIAGRVEWLPSTPIPPPPRPKSKFNQTRS